MITRDAYVKYMAAKVCINQWQLLLKDKDAFERYAAECLPEQYPDVPRAIIRETIQKGIDEAEAEIRKIEASV